MIRMIKLRRMKWAGHVAELGRRGMHIRYWWERQNEKRPVERQRRRWVDNTKMNFIEMGWNAMDWIVLVEDRDQWRALVNMVTKLWVP
jgi:hypothetical protein